MISAEEFDKRVTALWSNQKSMGREKKWKSGRRAGMVRKAAAAVEFTKADLHRWLSESVGLGIALCPYCRAPIDIISLTLDHIHPRSAGGEFSLANMQITCTDCNARKGNLSHEAFTALLNLMAQSFSRYDRTVLLGRLKASHHGSANRFFRDKDKPQPPSPLLPPPAKQAELGVF